MVVLAIQEDIRTGPFIISPNNLHECGSSHFLECKWGCFGLPSKTVERTEEMVLLLWMAWIHGSRDRDGSVKETKRKCVNKRAVALHGSSTRRDSAMKVTHLHGIITVQAMRRVSARSRVRWRRPPQSWGWLRGRLGRTSLVPTCCIATNRVGRVSLVGMTRKVGRRRRRARVGGSIGSGGSNRCVVVVVTGVVVVVAVAVKESGTSQCRHGTTLATRTIVSVRSKIMQGRQRQSCGGGWRKHVLLIVRSM
jgi:hypothetical protein